MTIAERFAALFGFWVVTTGVLYATLGFQGFMHVHFLASLIVGWILSLFLTVLLVTFLKIIDSARGIAFNDEMVVRVCALFAFYLFFASPNTESTIGADIALGATIGMTIPPSVLFQDHFKDPHPPPGDVIKSSHGS